MKEMIKQLIYPVLIVFLISCEANKDNKEIIGKIDSTQSKTVVDVIILKNTNFNKEIISNGKLSAVNKTDLTFETSGKTEKILKHNGQFVGKGGIIAILSNKELENILEKAKLNLEKAKIARSQELISRGYNPDETDSVPDKILKIISLNSGYSSSLIEYNYAVSKLAKLKLTAPFDGIIANIKKHVFEDINSGEVFCTLIDESKFYADFKILESELPQIKIGDITEIRPFNTDKVFKGKISEINPVVDNNGMISIKAYVLNNHHELTEGMNTEIKIRKKVPNCFVVPKDAVVTRQNKDVLFVYKHGTAYWTYVNIKDENSDSYSVEANADRNAHLNEGDTVIISDNMNLAHESKVELGEVIK